MSEAPLFEPRPPDLPALWISGDGPERDVVVSSRMRLARCVDGYRFKVRQQDLDGQRLTDHLRDVIQDVEPELKWLHLTDTKEVLRRVLFERHVVSREHMDDDHPRGVAYSNDGTTSIMVNEEDHLRMQVFAVGFDLEALDQRINALDDALAARLPFSFTERYGYLTSCPTNTGTGLRVSVMVHLPALSFRLESGRKEEEHGIAKVHNAAQRLGLTVRGMHGESSRAEGDFYQISNQVTLGRSPEQATADLHAVVDRVVEFERNVRRILLDEHREHIEDLVWRAWAVLRHARRMESAEAIRLLSALRLGVSLGLVEGVAVGTLHRLLVTMMPAHLQFRERRELGPAERDVVRAALIRDTLAGEARSGG